MAANRTGFDQLTSDSRLQEHWLRRLAAAIVDGIIVAIAIWLVVLLPLSIMLWAAGPFIFFSGLYGMFLFPFLSGLLFTLYAAFMESSYGHTIGKQFLGIRVNSTSGQRITMSQGFLRNISKIFWLLLLIDLLIGLATIGDPHQKYTDRMAGTIPTSAYAPSFSAATSPPPPPP